MTRAAALALLLALCACVLPPREVVRDEATAIATAQKLCNWSTAENLHAQREDKTWHVWDDAHERDAHINRYDTGGTYFCLTL
ncbi:MAG: hypothetical protein WDN08_17240 [Rhizomicrobium sp.]